MGGIDLSGTELVWDEKRGCYWMYGDVVASWSDYGSPLWFRPHDPTPRSPGGGPSPPGTPMSVGADRGEHLAVIHAIEAAYPGELAREDGVLYWGEPGYDEDDEDDDGGWEGPEVVGSGTIDEITVTLFADPEGDIVAEGGHFLVLDERGGEDWEPGEVLESPAPRYTIPQARQLVAVLQHLINQSGE